MAIQADRITEKIKKYFVVSFLELPYPYIERYVCVPQSWVDLRPEQQKVLVAYPSENPAITRNRVENNEKPHENWRSYPARMKYITDVYDDADNWIATKYDDGVADTSRSTTPNPNTSTDAASHVVPENNNQPDKNTDLKINNQDPSTSYTSSDHQEKTQDEPLKDKPPIKITLKRKLPPNATDIITEIPAKTIKAEPVDNDEDHSRDSSMDSKEKSYESYCVYSIKQEPQSPVLTEHKDEAVDTIEKCNRNSLKISLKKTLFNPMANNYGEIAKLIIDEAMNENTNSSSKTLQNSIKKQSDTEYLEFSIKEEIRSPLLIEESSDAEDRMDESLKETANQKNTKEQASTMQTGINCPKQSEPASNESTLSNERNKSKILVEPLLHNGKEKTHARSIETKDDNQRKSPHHSHSNTSDCLKNLLTEQIPTDKQKELNEKSHKNLEKDKQFSLGHEVNTRDIMNSSDQNLKIKSNQPFKLPPEVTEDVNSSAFKVLVQKDKRRIIITRPDEAGPNDETLLRNNEAKDITKYTSPAVPPSNIAKQSQTPSNFLTSSKERLTNPENQGLPISKSLNEKYDPKQYNYPQAKPHDHQNIPGIFNRFDQMADMCEQRLQNIAKTNTIPLQEPTRTINRPNQPIEPPCANGPKIKGYLLEDPRTGKVFIHPSTPENYVEQRPDYQNTGQCQNPGKNNSKPLNQVSRIGQPKRPHEKQPNKTSGRTFYSQDQGQGRLPGNPMNMNTNNQRPHPQMNPSNPHGVPNSFQPSNHPYYCDSYYHRRQISPVSQDCPYQDPRMQHQPEKPQMMRHGINADNRPLGAPNSFNGGYQSCPPMRNIVDERFASNPTSYSRPYFSYEARMEEWFQTISQKLDYIFAKLSKMS